MPTLQRAGHTGPNALPHLRWEPQAVPQAQRRQAEGNGQGDAGRGKIGDVTAHPRVMGSRPYLRVCPLIAGTEKATPKASQLKAEGYLNGLKQNAGNTEVILYASAETARAVGCIQSEYRTWRGIQTSARRGYPSNQSIHHGNWVLIESDSPVPVISTKARHPIGRIYELEFAPPPRCWKRKQHNKVTRRADTRGNKPFKAAATNYHHLDKQHDHQPGIPPTPPPGVE